MRRRDFLKGSVAVVATAVAAPILPVSEELVVYGRSPAMVALPDVGALTRMASTIIYGNIEYMPVDFIGFTARYDNAPA